MSSRARRPYLMGGQSLVDFFNAPVRFLKEQTMRPESEFEKPYLDEDYRKMHFDFPWPDWPPFPSFPTSPFPDIPGPSEKSSVCVITCYEPSDCDEPIWCHPSIWCGTDMICAGCVWKVSGATIGFSPHPFGGSKNASWGIDISIDSALVDEDGKALVTICMTDPCGNVCCEEVEVKCDVCCPTADPFVWDTEPPDTLVEDAGASSFSVEGGCPPYNFQISGTNWSLGNSGKQDELDNTIECASTADCVGTVSVTDFCGTIVTKKIRNTRGQWVLKSEGADNCILVGPATYHSGAYAAGAVFEYISEEKRQTESIISKGSAGSPYTCATHPEFCDAYCTDAVCLTSPFNYTSTPEDITPNCQDRDWGIQCFCHLYDKYYEWECS